MRIEGLSQPPPLEAHAVAVTAVNEGLPKDGQQVVVFQPDASINLPLELTGARIENNMLKADRQPRFGETVTPDRKAQIIAMEDHQLAAARAEFSAMNTEPAPITTPIRAGSQK